MARLVQKFLRRFLGQRRQFPPDIPSAGQKAARVALAEKFPGRILFDSNREGTFGIYVTTPEGENISRVLHSKDFHLIFPDVSPTGELITYVKTTSLDRNVMGEIWISRSDGGDAHKVADNGTFPTFGSDGQTLYFERERKKLVAVALDGSQEQQLFPKEQGIPFGHYNVIKPRVSPQQKPEQREVAFISNKKGRWNTWIADLESGQVEHLDEGCEPAWSTDGKSIAWVKAKGTNGESGIYLFNRKSKEKSMLQDEGPPRGQEYFPTLVADDQFLLYSACRDVEHSHLTANYQIFVKDLFRNIVTRITFDRYTNRWPKLLPFS